MYVTEEGYILTRNITKVKANESKFIKVIKRNKILISITSIFLSLILVEGILINQFISILKYL